MDIGQILVGIADIGENARVTAAAAEVPKFPASFDRTQKVLATMLCENTGASILDSGGAYGRHWQQNREPRLTCSPTGTNPDRRDYRWEEPATTLEVRVYNGKAEFEVTHNVFHWLAARLTYDRALTKRMRALGEREGLDGMRLAERFPEYLEESTGLDVGGIYGEGKPITVNTYNGEDLLSQVLQYVFFQFEGTDYVALQIHGGADVRGGYTEPVIFSVDDELAIFDNAKAGIAPDWNEVEARQAEIDQQETLFADSGDDLSNVGWSTDDGCHWYYQGTCGRDYDAKQLDKLPAVEISDRSEWVKGTIGVLPDGTALCPFTGCTLRAHTY